MGIELYNPNKKNDVAIIEAKGIESLIKPLTTEIQLFDTFVSGTAYVDKDLIKNLKIGDVLSLRREINKFDENSIMVLNSDAQKIGYIPEKDNVIFARLMDAGKKLIAKVNSINFKGDFSIVKIDIYLVDF